MITLIVVSTIIFILSYLTKARFGVIGLGLLAGVVTGLYGTDATIDFITSLGILSDEFIQPMYVAAALLVAPAAIAALSRVKYVSSHANLLGAIYGAVFAFVLASLTIRGVSISDNTAIQVVDFIGQYDALPILAGVAWALFDLLGYKPSKDKGGRK